MQKYNLNSGRREKNVFFLFVEMKNYNLIVESMLKITMKITRYINKISFCFSWQGVWMIFPTKLDFLLLRTFSIVLESQALWTRYAWEGEKKSDILSRFTFFAKRVHQRHILFDTDKDKLLLILPPKINFNKPKNKSLTCSFEKKF